MPENETLNPDARTASRWRPLKDQLDHGKSPSDIFPELEREFYDCLRRVWKQWRSRGVEPAALLDVAVNNPADLPDFIRRTGFDDYAQLLEDVVEGEPNANLEDILWHWLNAVWDCVRDQLRLDLHEVSSPDDFANRVNQMLKRLLRFLADNPSRIPRRPSRPSRTEPLDIDDFLDRPLL